MRKYIARQLMSLVTWLDPTWKGEYLPKAKKMGIGYHITKSDVRKWRKENPDAKSHRQALTAMTEECKHRIAGSILKGLLEKHAIEFNVSKTPYVADVTGWVFVYAPNEEE